MKLDFKIGSFLFKNAKSEKTKEIEACGCPCHTDQPWISHWQPCCKYTGQKLK